MYQLGSLRRFLANRSGLSAVEFALILPVLVTLYLGTVEVTQAVTAKRKLASLTSSVGDLVARATELTSQDVQDVFSAASTIMSPFGTGPLSMVVSTIWIDQDRKVTVDTSCSKNSAARAGGSSIALPSSLSANLEPNTGLVLAEAEYDFAPMIGYVLTGTISMSETYYLRPRASERIKMTC